MKQLPSPPQLTLTKLVAPRKQYLLATIVGSLNRALRYGDVEAVRTWARVLAGEGFDYLREKESKS